MTRIADIEYERMNADQRRVHDRVAAGPRGGVRGPLRIWLRSPDLADRLQHLGEFCRYRTSLPPRVSELAILVTARAWRAAYEWTAHAPIALRAGLDAAVIEAIRLGRPPEFSRVDEAVSYRVAAEIHRDRGVTDATYEEARRILGETAVVELIATIGYYTLIAMTINVFAVSVPDGSEQPFED
jgi:4-carboxymuconolactone decarboxylase